MTNEEILQKAIEKSEKNGYALSLAGAKIVDQGGYSAIIFSHNFAKALWGEEYVDFDGQTKEEHQQARDLLKFISFSVWHAYLESWQYHLQQMVLEKEPLKYLEQFL